MRWSVPEYVVSRMDHEGYVEPPVTSSDTYPDYIAQEVLIFIQGSACGFIHVDVLSRVNTPLGILGKVPYVTLDKNRVGAFYDLLYR